VFLFVVVVLLVFTKNFALKITEPYPVRIRSLSGRSELPCFLCKYRDRPGEIAVVFDVFISRACEGEWTGHSSGVLWFVGDDERSGTAGDLISHAGLRRLGR
jgi:hypothetical protein